MNATGENLTGALSRQARARIPHPLFHADWLATVFLHYDVEPAALQACVPFPLDLHNGNAYVSLVHFSLRGMRTHLLPRIGQCLLRPISDHPFLNVRTYVRHGPETGIYFLAEWLSNRLAIPLGRPLFGLPYHLGAFESQHSAADGRVRAVITGTAGALRYQGDLDTAPAPCQRDTRDEFLLERYTAFTHWRGVRRYFRVWHPPWPVAPLTATIEDTSLIRATGPWTRAARLIGAHYSPGVSDVWMGRPQFL